MRHVLLELDVKISQIWRWFSKTVQFRKEWSQKRVFQIIYVTDTRNQAGRRVRKSHR